MALHRLVSVTVGVPDVEPTLGYYREFGLAASAANPAGLCTVDGGEQLKFEHSPVRRVLSLRVGAEDPDDLARIARNLDRLEIGHSLSGGMLTAHDRGTGAKVEVTVAPKLAQEPTPTPGYNGPGSVVRDGQRAPGVLREGPVRPRKLGHVVMGSIDQEYSQRFFNEGIGFKISDNVVGRAAFMRCSTDHHDVLVQKAPVQFLHHTSWQVEDVDEVGRGASAMLEADPARHVWGLGRHHIGSNFFWYLRDPAGNFSEYYSDLDCIVDDALWKPEVFEGAKGLYNWGPPPPPSFLKPDDLAALMTGAHSS